MGLDNSDLVELEQSREPPNYPWCIGCCRRIAYSNKNGMCPRCRRLVRMSRVTWGLCPVCGSGGKDVRIRHAVDEIKRFRVHVYECSRCGDHGVCVIGWCAGCEPIEGEEREVLGVYWESVRTGNGWRYEMITREKRLHVYGDGAGGWIWKVWDGEGVRLIAMGESDSVEGAKSAADRVKVR